MGQKILFASRPIIMSHAPVQNDTFIIHTNIMNKFDIQKYTLYIYISFLIFFSLRGKGLNTNQLMVVLWQFFRVWCVFRSIMGLIFSEN